MIHPYCRLNGHKKAIEYEYEPSGRQLEYITCTRAGCGLYEFNRKGPIYPERAED